MGFFEDAQETFDRGYSAAKGVVSGVAGERLGFVRDFVRLCSDGWSQGWHERNGGNASYRLTAEDLKAASSFFYDTPSSWVQLGISAPQMAREYLLVTGAGKYLRNVEQDPDNNIGIVQINDSGDAWRLVWGLRNNGRPTSELASHVLVHQVRKEATQGANRVLYHAHPSHVVALTTLKDADPRTFTRCLWKVLTESIIAFPEGLGALPWMVPGSIELAQATADQMRTYPACIWALHGVFSSGADCDEAFGRVQAIEKAAEIYLISRAAHTVVDGTTNLISDEELRQIADRYDLQVHEDFLDQPRHA
ncbi:MAG: rhamnulose-1-phosphate aldolase [Eggerthellaceae bacterium]